MRPSVVVEGARVFLGDCRDVLKTLPDNSVDSVVTDPPYELGFMGKSWDSSGIAYDVTVWEECLRVLKPGGHILAFGGTRTWHRLAVAIEDAGFEIRDNIAWIYGSGFPKSLDVSKAIDKRGGATANFAEFRDAVKIAMKANNVSRSELQDALGNFMLSHYLTARSQPAIPNWTDYQVIRDKVGLGSRFDELFLPEAEREVIGQRVTGAAMSGKRSGLDAGTGGTDFGSGTNMVDETAPATPEAKKWQGWGTALKPAFEPVVVGRKPIEGTVANNVLRWGVGGLNIDGSRIGSEKRNIPGMKSLGVMHDDNWKPSDIETKEVQGRWPANVVLDEFTAGLLDEQSGVSVSNCRKSYPATEAGTGWGTIGSGGGSRGQIDSGGASRFFYQAKASKRDRNEGLNLCQCDKLQAWENEDQTAPPQADTDQSTPKDTGASGTPNNNGSEWNTSSSGSNTTDNSKTGNRSTTSTATNLTTESTTSSPLTALHTNASTRGASSETVSGGSPAKSADTRSRSTETTGMSAEKGGPSMDGANPATSPSLSSQSNVGSHQCAKCLGIIGGHPTVKPTQLMRYLIKLVTPEGGTVLDPFTGSGSTGKAALLDGFEFIGAELTEEYLPIIEGRLRWAVENRDEDGTLF